MSDLVEQLRKKHRLLSEAWNYGRKADTGSLPDLILQAADKIERLTEEVERLQGVINFALTHVVCKQAGNTQDPFAYLWKRDWDEFERLANAEEARIRRVEAVAMCEQLQHDLRATAGVAETLLRERDEAREAARWLFDDYCANHVQSVVDSCYQRWPWLDE
jgi:hypothetical protein